MVNIMDKYQIVRLVSVAAICLASLGSARAALPAFPGAAGGGARSAGGRGGRVIEVTNLNDSGAGSLRQCMEASGPRTCVFRTGGSILLQSGIRITNPFLTVAGQTAPGGGIELDASQLSSNFQNLFYIYTHNVVLRYLRLRVGNKCQGQLAAASGGNTTVTGTCAYHRPGPGTGITQFYIGNGDVHDVVIDHCSMNWSDNKNFSPYPNSGTVKSITLSWSILDSGINPHSTGINVGSGQDAANANLMTDIDFHHNFLAHIHHRLPLLKNKSSRWVNNLVYDHTFYMTQGLGGLQLDAIGNKYVAGPSSRAGLHEFQMSDNSAGGDTSNGTPTLYLHGNVGPNNASPAGNQYAMTAEVGGENQSEAASPIRSAWRRSSPLTALAFPIKADDVSALDAALLPTVGASATLGCDGNWILNRDSWDAKMVSDYQSRGGVTPDYNAITTHPTLLPGTPCASASHDGIPDVWATAHGLNPADATKAARINPQTGYTYLEDYLSGTTGTGPSNSACDVNLDRVVDVLDAQLVINQAHGIVPCTTDLNKDGVCNVIDIQRVVNAVGSGICVTP